MSDFDDDDEFRVPNPSVDVAYFDPDDAISSPSERLESDKRHPVLIFGASRAGKSTFIISLLQGLAKSAESASDTSKSVDVSFGESFYEAADARASAQRDMARAFYDAARINHVLARQALETTQGSIPFFIPLDLRVVGSSMPPVRIALLDGRGEWYEPNKPGSDSAFKEFQKDILDVLQNYGKGLSVILVAPYSLSDHDRMDVKNCDSGLWKCLDRYGECRSNPDDDSMLMLLTKWDQFAKPTDRDGEFSITDGSEVADILSRRYEMTWPRFQTINVGNDEWSRRSFMQYSSCTFIDGRPYIPDHLESDFIRYPRTVANWIYENARRFRVEDRAGGIDLPMYLFDDVVDELRLKVSISQRFLRAIIGK